MEQITRDTMSYIDVAKTLLSVINDLSVINENGGDEESMDDGIGIDVSASTASMSLPGSFSVSVPVSGNNLDSTRRLFDESWRFIFHAIAPCTRPFYPSDGTSDIDAAHYVRFKVFEICMVLGHLAGIDVGVDVSDDGWVTMSIILSSGDITIVAPRESLVPSVLLLPELEGRVYERGVQRKRTSIFASL